MSSALVVACMLTEGERAEIRALSLGLFTPGHIMRLLWSDSSPIVKRPVLRILNAFETDLNLIAQTAYVWDAFQTKLDEKCPDEKCKYICLLKSHMYILLLPKC